MAKLLGIRIQNFRSLKDVSIGQCKYAQGEALPPLACFVGPNGSGKSTILDAFGFIAQCLRDGVESACDDSGRGGLERLLTRGEAGPIKFELFFDDGAADRPIVYEVHIGEKDGVPSVGVETLRQRRKGEHRGKPYYFLKLMNGKGKVWKGTYSGLAADSKNSEKVALADTSQLGIAALGNLDKHPRIVRVREYIENWYLSYFVPDAARRLPVAGAQRWLDRTGSNVGNVLQYFKRQYPNEFKKILKEIAAAIPGIKKITPVVSQDKRLLLKFDERGYSDPFFQSSMSDGTLKMVAYAVLLADPEPRPFLGIEEPENGLYVELIEELARKLNEYAESPKVTTQILVTTHSPYFVDALLPSQVWFVDKGDDGYTRVRCTQEMPHVQELVNEGIPLGSLWYSRHFTDGGGA